MGKSNIPSYYFGNDIGQGRQWCKTPRLCIYLQKSSPHDVLIWNSDCLRWLLELSLCHCVAPKMLWVYVWLSREFTTAIFPPDPSIIKHGLQRLANFGFFRDNTISCHLLAQFGVGQAWPLGLGGGMWCEAVLLPAPSQGAPEDAVLAAVQVNWRQSWKEEHPSCLGRPQVVMAALRLQTFFINFLVMKHSFRLCCHMFFQLDLHQSSALQKVLIHAAQGHLTGFSEDCWKFQQKSGRHGKSSYLGL